ncbi:MAG: hypothetical protein NC320_12360, partial [Clostridium sp.]|nr:hypothetical protein [Clostridium sp.]
HQFATNCIKLGFDMKTLSEILGYNFEAVETLSPQDAANAKSFGKQFMEMVKTSTVEQETQKAG